MANDKELEAGLRAMARDFHLPGGGQMKLSRLVAQHLGWFDTAERRGMGWRDMLRALTSAGVAGKSGKPLSVGTLSATVWRKRAEAEAGTDRAGRQARPASPELRPAKEAKRLSARQSNEGKHASSQPIDGHAQAIRRTPTAAKRGRASEVRTQNNDVLAFMDRARAVRRRSE
jgi:hypothetical protein